MEKSFNFWGFELMSVRINALSLAELSSGGLLKMKVLLT